MSDLGNAFSCFEDLPEEIRKRVALIESVLHISEDLKGNQDLLLFISKMRHKSGILNFKFHQPSDFDEQYGNHATRFAVGETAIQTLAIKMIARAHTMGASDIHIVDNGAYTRIKFRCLGMLCDDSQLEADTGRRMINAIYGSLGESGDSSAFSVSERHDGRIANHDCLPKGVHSVRIHSEPIECPQAEGGTGTFMALRLLYDSSQAYGTLEERLGALGFSSEQCLTMNSLTRRTGLIIISGPTGHGKSTVLKHVMESMSKRYPEKAFHSVEDPPEYYLREMQQIKVVTNQGVSSQKRGEAYTDSLAGAMRSDPDVLMLGEIRYPEAAVAAINGALTGHAVWATVHANNGFGIITRLENLLRGPNFPNPLEALCDPNVLAGLEYQRLIPKLCTECKKPYRELANKDKLLALPEDLLKRLSRTGLTLEQVYGDSNNDGIFVRGDGCSKCQERGLVGQSVVAEVIELDQEILGTLRQGGGIFEAHQQWRIKAMAKFNEAKGTNSKCPVTYIDHAIELIKHGIVDPALAELRLGVPLNFNNFFDKPVRR